MKYLSKSCTRCGNKMVVPPSNGEIENRIILVKCDFCNKKSRYNIVSHVDGSKGYYLSKWGRGNGEDLILVRRWISRMHKNLSSEQIRIALDKVYRKSV